MNRRQFMKRADVLVGALLTGAGDLLRGETPAPSLYSQTGQLSRQRLNMQRDELEQRALGNRSIYLFAPWGIKSDAAHRLARDLYDGELVTDRLDQFGQACAVQKAELPRGPEHFFHYPIKDDMARILAANPEMTREDAFFQAVIERADNANA